MPDKKSIFGMYRALAPDYPKVVVGKYAICRMDDNGVWIEHESGEGAEFPDALFESAIESFYNRNF